MIVFQSEVGADVMMFDEVAQRMMELMGKEKSVRGVVTVEQIPQAVAALRAAIAADKAAHGSDEGEEAVPRVSLTQRAVPLIELLEISLARGKPVMWGV